MMNYVVSTLIELAENSDMNSRHAAAIVYNRRILSKSINYSLSSKECVQWKYRERLF